MVELLRAYSAFATYGHLVDPHYIDSVEDRDGTVIESWEAPAEWPVVMDPAVAGITHWLLRQVATGGTAAASNSLGLHVAGKTGTTNDFFDAWFVGYNPDLIAGAWIGYDQPRSLGLSFTGGRTALPIWMDFMKAAAPRDQDHDFPAPQGVAWVPIDEATGRVAGGGLAIPMLPGTAPEGDAAVEIGQKTSQDLLTTDF
jgi:penicillin-binding protein 1A